jgi:predicted enzyme related to lactoylglutathione lyase
MGHLPIDFIERLCYDMRTDQYHQEDKVMLEYVQTISIPVTDQDRALDFYVNTLGFEKRSDEPMSPEERWVVVAPAGGQTGIMLSKANASGSGLPIGQFTSFIFYSADMEGTCAELEAKGVKFTVPPHAEPWGKWAQFADQDGNELAIWSEPAGMS